MEMHSKHNFHRLIHNLEFRSENPQVLRLNKKLCCDSIIVLHLSASQQFINIRYIQQNLHETRIQLYSFWYDDDFLCNRPAISARMDLSNLGLSRSNWVIYSYAIKTCVCWISKVLNQNVISVETNSKKNGKTTECFSCNRDQKKSINTTFILAVISKDFLICFYLI